MNNATEVAPKKVLANLLDERMVEVTATVIANVVADELYRISEWLDMPEDEVWTAFDKALVKAKQPEPVAEPVSSS